VGGHGRRVSVTAISDWLHDLDDIARARLGFVAGFRPPFWSSSRYVFDTLD